MKTSAVFTTVLLLAVAAPAADAQEQLSIGMAVELGMVNNQSLRGAGHEVEATKWGKVNAVSNFLPKVDVAAGVTRIDPQTERYANAALDFIQGAGPVLGIPPSAFADMRPFAYRDTYTAQFTVVQPIYNGGAELVGLDAASADRDRSLYAYEDAEQEVIARVKTSYLTVLKVQELVALSHENAQRIRRYLEMAQRRAEAGMRTKTDVMRWEVEYGDAEDKVIRAENALALAHLQLNEAMGVDLHRRFVLARLPVTDTMFASAAQQPPALASLVDTSPEPQPAFLDRHPSMLMMQSNLDLAGTQVSAAMTNFKPRINLAFQYGWEKNGTVALDGYRPWALALSVSYPIFNGFGDYANVQKAEAELRKTETQVETFRRGLLLQATGAELTLKATRKRAEVAQKAREQAHEVLNSVSRRYETGGASNVDLIDAQTAYTSAQADYITAAYDHAIAEIAYARATGTLTR